MRLDELKEAVERHKDREYVECYDGWGDCNAAHKIADCLTDSTPITREHVEDANLENSELEPQVWRGYIGSRRFHVEAFLEDGVFLFFVDGQWQRCIDNVGDLYALLLRLSREEH